MTTNNLGAIAAALNVALYSHVKTINVEGKPGTFTGELTSRVITIAADMQQMIEDIATEMNKQDYEAEAAFFRSHPELNP
jgi:hypothetical protein